MYYGSSVTLRAAVSESGSTFALLADEDERPRIVGRWSPAAGSLSSLLRVGVQEPPG